MCKLSIITINRNNASGLRKTIESVISQTFTDFEYIVIDGASKDESVDVIKKYSDKISYWISEPDKGIYNAMNKGILKASGDYLLFLNSGDWLADGKVIEKFCLCSLNEDIIAGNCFLIDSLNNIQLCKSISKSNLNYDHFFHWGSLPHQATFLKRELFKLYGLYNEKMRILSDTEFVFKLLIINNVSYSHWECIISYFDTTGISYDKRFEQVTNTERVLIFTQNLPLVYKSYKKLSEENQALQFKINEYNALRNGKFSLFIRFFLWLKRVIK